MCLIRILLIALAFSQMATGAPVPKTESGFDYHPTKVGVVWVKLSGKVEYQETITEVEKADQGVLVTIEKTFGQTGQKSKSISKVIVSQEGVAVVENGGIMFPAPYRILKLPSKVGDDWVSKATPLLQEKFVLRGAERVKVPAGEFDAILVESSYVERGETVKEMRWYVSGIGVVKWTLQSGQREQSVLLKKFSDGRKQ